MPAIQSKKFLDGSRFTSWSAVCLGIFACMALTTGSLFASEREIAWTEDYDGAIHRAAASNSILLLHFYGDYCPPCKLLDKKTFKDPALVSAINSTVIPVKINADRRRDLVEKYNVNRWPTDVYLFPNGDELYRGVSDQDPSVYTQKIKRLALRHRDWTLEREAIAKTTQRRQDKELAANSPQIQSEKPVYAGSAGAPVKSQAASWQTATGLNTQVAPYIEPSRPGVPEGSPQAPHVEGASNSGSANNAMTVHAAPIVHSQARPSSDLQAASELQAGQTGTKPQRVIDNPFVAKQPLIVPAQQTPALRTRTEQQTRPDQLAQEPIAPSMAPEAPAAMESNRPVPARPISGSLTLSNLSEMHMHQETAPQTPPSHDASTARATEPTHIVADSIGLDGHCPVELIESLSLGTNPAWVSGSPAYAVRHRGRIYHCSSERARQKLLSAPDRFTPCLSCFDLVCFFETGDLVDGKCEFGCIEPNTKRIFLFATKENLAAFDRDNQRYAQLIDDMSPERVAGRTDETRIR